MKDSRRTKFLSFHFFSPIGLTLTTIIGATCWIAPLIAVPLWTGYVVYNVIDDDENEV